MSSALESLLFYCPSGTAEGEKEILNDVFVGYNDYVDIITPQVGSPRILVGKKGTGKSALLKFHHEKCRANSIPSLYITPSDLKISWPNGTDLSSLIRECLPALIDAIAVKVGSLVEKGLVSEGDRELIQKAVSEGQRDPDLIAKILSPLSIFAKSVSGIDWSKLVPNYGAHVNITGILTERLAKNGMPFYLLIDDTDQVASLDNPNHLNRIWAFLLACRKLSEKTANFKIIISLREEIWRRLETDRSSQRDQVDHFKPLTINLFQNDEQIEEIVRRRILLASKRAGLPQGREESVLNFFSKKTTHLPFSRETRDWVSFITKSSRERPRDAINFVSLLIKFAQDQGLSKIEDSITNQVADQYSTERVENLATEYEMECPQIKQIVESLSRISGWEVDTETMKSVIAPIPSSFSVTIRGEVVRPDNPTELMRIWSLLFEAGILNVRLPDIRRVRGFRHVLFRKEPGFVSMSRWTEMQKCTWEVHPAYRSFIMRIQEDEKARRSFKM